MSPRRPDMAVAGHVAFVVLFVVYVVAVLIVGLPTSTPAWLGVAIVLTGSVPCCAR